MGCEAGFWNEFGDNNSTFLGWQASWGSYLKCPLAQARGAWKLRGAGAPCEESLGRFVLLHGMATVFKVWMSLMFLLEEASADLLMQIFGSQPKAAKLVFSSIPKANCFGGRSRMHYLFYWWFRLQMKTSKFEQQGRTEDAHRKHD